MLHLAFLRGEGFSAEKICRGVGELTKYVKGRRLRGRGSPRYFLPSRSEVVNSWG